MLLAIDTSTRNAGVALYNDGLVQSCRNWHSPVNHTAELMPAIAQIMHSRDLTPGQLEGIAVALGPGGFSALRVGMSAVKGLAATAGKPVVGVGTLDMEAYPYLKSGLQVCALLDAGRGEVASAIFGTDGRRVRDDLVCPTQELLETIDSETLFCGEGVAAWRDLIQERLGTLGRLVLPAPATRLWALCELGWQALAAGDTAELATLQPIYMRMPTVGGPKRRDWTPQR